MWVVLLWTKPTSNLYNNLRVVFEFDDRNIMILRMELYSMILLFKQL